MVIFYIMLKSIENAKNMTSVILQRFKDNLLSRLMYMYLCYLFQCWMYD